MHYLAIHIPGAKLTRQGVLNKRTMLARRGFPRADKTHGLGFYRFSQLAYVFLESLPLGFRQTDYPSPPNDSILECCRPTFSRRLLR